MALVTTKLKLILINLDKYSVIRRYFIPIYSSIWLKPAKYRFQLDVYFQLSARANSNHSEMIRKKLRLGVQKRKKEVFNLDLPFFYFVTYWYSEIYIHGPCCKNRGGNGRRAHEGTVWVIGSIFLLIFNTFTYTFNIDIIRRNLISYETHFNRYHFGDFYYIL